MTNTTTDSWAGQTRPYDQAPGGESSWAPRPPDAGRSGGRSVAVGLGIVFSLLLIVWGVLWVVMLVTRQEETMSVGVDQPFSSAVIYTDSGDVRVVGGEGAGSTVSQRMRWSLTKPTVTTEVRDDVLHITGNCPGIDFGLGCQLDLVVAVPAGTSVELVSGSGDISVRGLNESVAVRTGSGDVDLEDLDSTVEARTGSGDVEMVGVASADVSVVTGSGDVSADLDQEPDAVSVRTGSGDLDIRVPRGAAAYHVEVNTGSGDQHVDVASDPDSLRTIAARTGSGDVTIAYD